jgi:HAD superfamily hydrolase (TIGR01662 family)
MTPEIVITVGIPGCGKSSFVKSLTDSGYRRINRDQVGGGMTSAACPIYQLLRACFDAGDRQFVLDNTFAKREQRAVVLEVAKGLGLPVRVLLFPVDLAQAQVFAARRQVQRLGKLLRPGDDYKAHADDPNMFPPGVQYAYQKTFVEPTLNEGFASIETVKVETVWGPEYVNRAIFLDLDGTVRVTPDEKACPWPRNVSEVWVIRPMATGELLRRYRNEGWLIFAVTNQSGVSREPSDPKYVSEATVVECIEATEAQLGLVFDGYAYATDRGGPPQSFWRKPLPGMPVMFIEQFKLNPSRCIFVGDMTSDKTCADRAGIPFIWAHEFFKI